MPSRSAVKAKPLRGGLRPALTARAGLALCALRKVAPGGMKGTGVSNNCVVGGCAVSEGVNLVCFEDRLMAIYEGYESICLLTVESKYVPASHLAVLLGRFNELFAAVLSDFEIARRLSQTDPGFDHPTMPD